MLSTPEIPQEAEPVSLPGTCLCTYLPVLIFVINTRADWHFLVFGLDSSYLLPSTGFLVNGWRFEVPCLSVCAGYRGLFWKWIPAAGAPLSASVQITYVAPTGCFFSKALGSRVMGRLNMPVFRSVDCAVVVVVVDWHVRTWCKAELFQEAHTWEELNSVDWLIKKEKSDFLFLVVSHSLQWQTKRRLIGWTRTLFTHQWQLKFFPFSTSEKRCDVKVF